MGTQHVAREPAVAGARLDHDERVGIVELVPTPVERSRDARTEERADLRARDEIATGTAGAVPGREEANVGLVQRHLDEPIERDRTFAPDEARDRVGGAPD